MISNRLPARMRALGMELAAARERTGKTTKEAAFGIGLSAPTLNRSENAKRLSPITDIAGLLALYEVTGDERKRIMELADRLDAPEWLEAGDRLPRLLRPFATFEARATSLMDVSFDYVPGLLQIEEYARAVHSTQGVTGADQDARVKARLERQKVLVARTAPRYTAVIEEAALRRTQGGSESMVRQVKWLIDRAWQPNIDIHVIPFRRWGYPNPGSFITMGFRQDPPIVFFENLAVAGFLDAPDHTQLFHNAAAKLMRFALDSADTVKFLTMLAADYERG
ncbi:helix-turn-helix transcriptional regulator [Alloactinosynnema sp. L-07]|uniref:helix-turn-helix domain-containing protein n=1 Tax=Alloactinosynnema sp. L-07 TaxID=1653480 RepID=UPI0012F9C631|nr:helix-turn-helix transcriptional regulator [Alloactinosynnema sp. L-07]